jgi:hypothetical protein
MARDFDGTNDLILRGADDASLDVGSTDSIAFAFWVRMDAAASGSSRAVTGKRQDSSPTSAGWMFSKSSNFLFFRVADGSVRDDSDGFDMASDTWYHIMALGNRGAVNQLVIYRDGVAQGAPTTITATGSWANAIAFRVGSEGSASSFWDGKFADMRVWIKPGAAFSTAEIQGLLSARFGAIPYPNLLQLWWPLWGRSDPEPDWSSHALTGAVTEALRFDHPPILGAEWLRATRRRLSSPDPPILIAQVHQAVR